MGAQLPLLPLFPNSHKLAVELAPRRERQPGTCKRCKLSFNSGNPCLPVDGKVGGLLIVSDYPGEQEDKNGIPFCGASGQFLRNHIKAMWGSQPVAFTNALNCRVSANPTMTQLAVPIKKCRDYLRDTLEEVKPTRVIAMGAVAIYSITGRMLPPMSVRRGYTWLSNGTPVFYMTNPAHACRNYFLKSRFETDLRWALFTNPRRRNGVYIVIRSLEEAAYAEKRLMDNPRWHTFDCETKGRMFDAGFGVTTVSICKGGDDYVFVWDEVSLANPKLCASMKRVLESEVGKGGFNVKYDINAVFADPDLRIEVPNVTADLMLWRHQSDSNIKDNSLNVCTEILGLGGAKEEGHTAVDKMVKAMKKSAKKSLDFKDQLQFGETRDQIQEEFEAVYPDVRAQAFAYAKIDQPTRNKYCCRDAYATDQGILAFQDVMAKSEHMKWMWEEIYRPAIRGMAILERTGMAVDKNAVIALARALDQSLSELKYQLSVFGKFDPDSPASLGRFLFGPRSMGGLELTAPMNKKGKSGSTEAYVLDLLRGKHPVIPVIEEYRKLATLQKRYARGMLPYICEDGRVHSSFLLEGTDTARLSSRDPNLQNIPAKQDDRWAVMVRNCFVTRPGYTLVAFDYSQHELRIAALLSQDPKFIEVVNSGQDIHRATAALVYNKEFGDVTDDERTYTKRTVFGLLFGMRAYKLFMDMKLASVQHAQALIDKIFGQYVRLHEWLEGNVAYARKNGCIWVIWKGKPAYRRYVFDILSPDKDSKEHAERQCYNCVDEETEALTRRGWVRGFDLKKSDVLLTKNPETGELEWQKMTGLKKWPKYRGRLVEFSSKTFSAVTTPEHRWLVDVDSSDRANEVTTTDEMSRCGRHKIHRTGEWCGAERVQLSDDFVRLCGWFLTDGTLYAKKPGRVPQVFVFQSKKPNIRRIQALSTALGFDRCPTPIIPKNGNYLKCWRWSIKGELRESLLSWLPDRLLTIDFLEVLTKPQLHILRETMLLGDGHRERGGKTVFAAGTPTKRDMFQTLCALCGIATTSRYVHTKSEKSWKGGCWRVTLLRATRTQVTAQQRREFVASQPIWCPIVPNTFFVARRNGCVYITGNTPVQGSAVLHMNRGIFDVAEWISETKFPAFMVNTVHDALYLEVRDDCVPESLVEIPKILKRHENPQVPLVVDAKIGPRLGMLEKAKKS